MHYTVLQAHINVSPFEARPAWNVPSVLPAQRMAGCRSARERRAKRRDGREREAREENEREERGEKEREES